MKENALKGETIVETKFNDKCLKMKGNVNQSNKLMQFSFVSSLIFENQKKILYTYIFRKNIFFVTLKSKYENLPNYDKRKTPRYN